MHVTRSAHEPTCETLSLLGISIIGGSVGFPQLLLLAVKKISNFLHLHVVGMQTFWARALALVPLSHLVKLPLPNIIYLTTL